MKNYFIRLFSLIILFLFLLNCESKDSNKSNPLVSFGTNIHVINCPASAKAYIDGIEVGIIPEYCDTIIDCQSENTLNKEVEIGPHVFSIKVEGESGSCLRIRSWEYDLNERECKKIFLDLTKRDEYELQANAKVIAFHAEKCMCCWGWDIEIVNDTIRTEDIKVGNAVGYEINEPIPVYIELGQKEENCSHYFPNLEFYTIDTIVIIN